ncbi:MAG: bifunctional hydroxymethylpyrimidine kinase/phosphomethylpyrimidine kinase [Methyloligellaceae bacterium]
MFNSKTPIAVTIAGSDSSGGAGIQADLKTFSALGVYGASIITALTAQNTLGVSTIHIPPADFVYDQIRSVFTDLNVGAVKIGMLANEEIILAVSSALREFYSGSIILDPVMVATSGDRLLQQEAEAALISRLIPGADLLTPNLAEAACLLDTKQAESEQDMHNQLNELMKLGAEAVLLKGGHGTTDKAIDYFQSKSGVKKTFSADRIKTGNTHGTGCTLSSAICAGLVKGLQLTESITEAKKYLTKALEKSGELKIGNGPGPVHHFHNIWPESR